MNWKNEEQYPDYTAALAMLRTAARNPAESDAWDDECCWLLVEAIVRQAVEDHICALRRLPSPSAVKRLKDTETFFRSDYFRRLTNLSGEQILRLIREEMNEA